MAPSTVANVSPLTQDPPVKQLVQEMNQRPFRFKPTTAFYIFLAANTLAALFSPIQDCDEVFNYWEPTHYLNHGSGLQTWEYSPDYAIRSWAYTGIHASITALARLISLDGSKLFEFYGLRCVLGLVCALCESKLYYTIAKTINPRAAVYFLMILVFSPGMYHASPAYLPSTFAMYTTMLGASAFLDWRGGIKTARGIMWFAAGSLLGWPFAGALVLPFIAEEVIMAFFSGSVFETAWRFVDGGIRSVGILAFQVAVDTFFYRTLVCVPMNIVLYNVFSGGSRGPNIYGVEPWHFYVRNLTLNFNIWFWLAAVALPLVLLQYLFIDKVSPKQTLLRSVVSISPFYLWLGIFTLQPHKEERFMYPAYPLLAFNAALSLHILLGNFGKSPPGTLRSQISPEFKLAVVSLVILGSFNLGALRTIGTMTAYSAPLNVYKPLQKSGVVKAGDNVCLGKEWYRFPSSYFLPDQSRARFVKSEFTGLLPGSFSEANEGSGYYPGTWMIPSGMNDENKEDPEKYINITQCQFLIDSKLPSAPATSLEPDYIYDTKTWEKLSCSPFMDAGATPLLGRILWVPEWSLIPAKHRRVWGEYCLLRRKA
ncbi:unnamed protein product [Periconia digitata]|uniref:Mannosyltransferase n=1 Tax=Periconia digitata TaxID=1303443 RepID=A0A9W4UE96_9PLEO|nr:unnamed protein product [Periconia digitata]